MLRPWNRAGLTLKPCSQNPDKPDSAAAALAHIRVAIVTASKLERLGWSIVVDSQPDMEAVGQFASLSAALAFLAGQTVDVALVDEAMLTAKSCEALAQHARTCGSRFLMMTRHPIDEAVVESRYAFVSRCLLKGLSAADLLAAIRQEHQPAAS